MPLPARSDEVNKDNDFYRCHSSLALFSKHSICEMRVASYSGITDIFHTFPGQQMTATSHLEGEYYPCTGLLME